MKLSPSARQMEWKRFMESLERDHTDPVAELEAADEEWARTHRNCFLSIALLALPCAVFAVWFGYAVYWIWERFK